jgi:hypothetical protein
MSRSAGAVNGSGARGSSNGGSFRCRAVVQSGLKVTGRTVHDRRVLAGLATVGPAVARYPCRAARRGGSRRALPVVSDCQVAPSTGTGASLSEAAWNSMAKAGVQQKSLPYSSRPGSARLASTVMKQSIVYMQHCRSAEPAQGPDRKGVLASQVREAPVPFGRNENSVRTDRGDSRRLLDDDQDLGRLRGWVAASYPDDGEPA